MGSPAKDPFPHTFSNLPPSRASFLLKSPTADWGGDTLSHPSLFIAQGPIVSGGGWQVKATRTRFSNHPESNSIEQVACILRRGVRL